MEELSAEDLQQLEERLYSQVHHSFDDNSNTVEQTKNYTNSEKNANSSKFLSKRYWTNKSTDEPQQQQQQQQQTGETYNEPENNLPDNKSAGKTTNNNKPNNNLKKTQAMQKPNGVARASAKLTKHNHNNSNNSKIRNPFAKPQTDNPKYRKSNHNNTHPKQNSRIAGPLAEKLQKIQRVNQIHNKKQKANNARAKMLANPKVVETINLDLDSDTNDDDEVVIVPLPPTPIVSIDDSDEEMPADSTQQSVQQAKVQVNQSATEALPENASRCTSPASVMSHDDFIGQGDRHRLLMVTSNTDSFLEAPTVSPTTQQKRDSRRTSTDDIECIGTFIKPSLINSKEKAAGKQDYRVGGSEFRAIDVYESESDIVSDGVYSKGSNKTQMINTSIHNSLEQSDDDDVEEDIGQPPSKTKRLRKRRASTTLRSSESNCGAGSSDSDCENDGVAETGVPFIYRGPALESQKSKKKRKRTMSTVSTGRMSDTEFVATLNSLAKGDNNANELDENDSESDSHENIPTARDIAEKVLNTNESDLAQNDEVIEVPSTSSAIAQDNEAIPAEIADDVEKILLKINEFNEKKAQEELSDDNEDLNITTESHILAASDESTSAMDVEIVEKGIDDDDGNKIKYFFGYSPANYKCFSDGCGWNEEMRRFYNYSWGGENFREDTILRSMKRSPHLWRISGLDRFPNMMPRGKREKCMNCLSFGHSRAKCPKPKRPLVCYMCGESGHLEARCPNTRCLRCGSETMSFVPSCKRCMYWNNRICPICKLRGHSLNDCPDKWRRYHSTIKPNEFPNPNVIYNRRRFCCFCGMRGHLADECRKAVHRTEYPIVASEIKSFEKSYDDVILSPYPPPGLKCRLLYDPNLIVNFTMAEKTTRFLSYGRFLNAVGLGRLIGAKNLNARQNVISPPSVTVTGNVVLKTPDQRSDVVEVAQASTTTAEKSQPTSLRKSKTPTTTTSTTTATELASTSRLNMPPPPAPTLPAPIDFDSDSNYSFSEHFEVSSSVEPVSQSARAQTSVTAPLPDFIPLGGGGNRYKETLNKTNNEDSQELGISSRFVEAHSDDDQEIETAADVSRAVEQHKPCEAKIFISNERYRYFQSKAGQEYLCKFLPEYELTGSLEKTSAGYALFLTGLPKNQDKFQQALLKKYEELNDTKTQQQIDNQVPKNVKPLIRFLRDSINQLQNNLGSATDLYKKLYDLEKWHTKSGMKTADRIRRTLNMIFLGQAGLHNGDVHFEVLLKALRTLLSDFENIEKVPKQLREEINASWRLLFTSFDHKRYANLLATYIQLPAIKRNRIPTLQIDPKMLGNTVIDVSLSKEQKERLNDFIKNEPIKSPETESTEKSMLLLNVVVPEQQQTKYQTTNKKITNQTETLSSTNKEHTLEKTTTEERIQLPNKSNTNNVSVTKISSPLQKNTEELLANSNTQNDTKDATTDIDHQFCLILITAIEKSLNSEESGARIDASKMPSQFWSTKSKELLLQLIELAKSSKSANLGRLENIYKVATEGKLSFVNYSDVLKIHKRTLKK